MKKFKSDPKKVVGTSGIIPAEDTDEKFLFYDIQGESVYSNPPNPQQITTDSGAEEDTIWAFGKDMFNQDRINNTYSTFGNTNHKFSYAPFWGEKLTQMAWFKRDKVEKFNRHWGHRLGLEALKMKHANQFGQDPNPMQLR